jgi:LuxR family transcriptional regulator, maltose regulon positive regulatory protein
VDPRLVVPPLPPRHISRPRLVAGLDSAADAPLVLLAAGPGAGKTVLLSDWVGRGRAKVAWMTVTVADAAPQRFWRLLWSALGIYGQHGEHISRCVPLGDSIERVQELLAGLPGPPDQPVLVIDDAHLLTHPDVLEDLDGLIRIGTPPVLRLVLAARSDPLLPLHRYRLAGQMRELRARDLAMTRPEMAELLAAYGVTLTSDAMETLLARTEGWVAGVRLSAMRMENSRNPARFVSELAMGEGSIGEYLMAEVLRGQPEPVRKLMTETSMFDEVTGPLAEAVTGLEECADMLARLARDNSFVIPVDPARTRFRYHQLFGEILRHELQLRERGMVPELMRRAAAYFERSGDFKRALYWTAKVGAWPDAASVLVNGGLVHAFVHRDDISSLGFDSWPLRVRQGADTRPTPESAIASSAVAAVLADAESAVRQLHELDLPVEDGATSAGMHLIADLVGLILGTKAGDAKAVEAAVERMLARTPDTSGSQLPGLRATVLLALASTMFWHGRNNDADVLLRTALTEAERIGPPVTQLEVLATSALVDSLRSRPRHAEDAEHRAHAMLHRHGKLSTLPALELAAATRLLMAADLTGAHRTLERAHVPHTVGTDPALVVAREIGKATVLLASGDTSQARVVAQQAPHTNLPLLTAIRETLVADTETLLGRPHGALELLRNYREDGDLAVLAALPRARAYLALHDTHSAQNCVRAVLTATSTLVSRYSLAEAMIFDARIALLNDDQEHALEMVSGAIELAQDDIVLPFLAVQEGFSALLARHPALADRWPRPPGSGPVDVLVPGHRRTADGLPEPLTRREQAVLRFLATSLSPGEIADEMCLSVNTVKTHQAAIYRKLAASRRKEAVLRAQELELL